MSDMTNSYALNIISTGKVVLPKRKEVLIVDLAKHDNAITKGEVEFIHAKTDWRFRFCVIYYKTNVRKAIFERFV